MLVFVDCVVGTHGARICALSPFLLCRFFVMSWCALSYSMH